MDTTSTVAVYEGLRVRLLDFVPVAPSPLAGGSLRSRGFKLFAGDFAPDKTDWSGAYGLFRLVGMVTSTAGLREAGQLEVMLFGRPRKVWDKQLEHYADAIDQAMKQFTDPRAGGLVFSRERSRDTLPPFPAPADREVVQIRLVYALVIYPQYLTALGTSFVPSTT